MKRFSKLAVVAVAVVVSCGAVAEAQRGRQGPESRPGQGPSGRPGQGGPMMMRGSFGGGLFGLLRIEEVQKEIELLDEQQTQIEEYTNELRAQRGGPEGRERPDFRSMSEEERQKAFEDMRKRMEEHMKASNAKLKEILLPHQVKRLEEIALQRRGVNALSDPEIAEKIGLSDSQKKELEEAQAANRETMIARGRELFQRGRERPDREKVREQFNKLREEADARLLAVLTPDQMKKFEELKGEPFEMPERTFGQGRGGFRGRGDQGGPEGQRGPGDGGSRRR